MEDKGHDPSRLRCSCNVGVGKSCHDWVQVGMTGSFDVALGYSDTCEQAEAVGNGFLRETVADW
jgi:hypothetical protein